MTGYEQDLSDIERLNDFISRFEILLDTISIAGEVTLVLNAEDTAEIIRLMKDQRDTKEAIAKWRIAEDK